MSCRYKNECPSYSGWCDGPKQDFSRCVEFLIVQPVVRKVCRTFSIVQEGEGNE